MRHPAPEAQLKIVASAPGKMVLCGEYAVLQGAPALALAVDRRAHVEIRVRSEGTSLLESSLLDRVIPCTIGPSGITTDPATSVARSMPLVNDLVRQLAGLTSKEGFHLPPLHVILNTQQFYREGKREHTKLGLGSSAALLVALSAAFRCLVGALQGRQDQDVTWPEVWALHQALPNQRGSGIDVASSYHGQLILFQKRSSDTPPSVRVFELPSRLHLWMVWTGRSTSTSVMLDQLARWQKLQPEAYRASMKMLSRAAQQSAEYAEAGRVDLLLQSFRSYAKALKSLSEASGVEIISKEHQEIQAAAESMGLVYKPSGAGGGDIGFVATEDVSLIEPFRHRIELMGYDGTSVLVASLGHEVMCKMG